jgi:hypothetical protein
MSGFWDDVWGSLFTTDGAAQKAAKKFAKDNGLPDPVGPESGAISSLTDAVSVTKLVWLNLSDYRMWRSLGWLLLGIILMILGFVVWNRKAIGSAAGKLAL